VIALVAACAITAHESANRIMAREPIGNHARSL
jgi:hypothetical protein